MMLKHISNTEKNGLKAILFLLNGIVSVGATNLSTTSSTLREFTQTAYPIEIFYVVMLIGVVCLVIDIMFVAAGSGVPASAMTITSIVGFMVFLVAAYMAPFAAKITNVVTDTEVRSVANYVLSPEISYLCLGLATICLLFVALGVLRYFQLLAENEKRLKSNDHQFEMYMRGEYE